MIWTAVRFGLEGVTVALAVTQIGMIAAIQLSGYGALDVTAFPGADDRARAVTGLAVGVLVREQQRMEQHLRLQQEALYRAARVGSMGEFAAALAHEINQPLTAIGNYTRLAREAAEKHPADTAMISEATGKAAEQVDRAADLVRRIREFIRLGRSEISAVAVKPMIEQVQQLCQSDLDQRGIALEVHVARGLPRVLADSLQIQQVAINLVRNAAEALTEAGRYDGRIIIGADHDPSGDVSICVRDNGPGFDATVLNSKCRAIHQHQARRHRALILAVSFHCRNA